MACTTTEKDEDTLEIDAVRKPAKIATKHVIPYEAVKLPLFLGLRSPRYNIHVNSITTMTVPEIPQGTTSSLSNPCTLNHVYILLTEIVQ